MNLLDPKLAKLSALNGVSIAVIGYGAQGRAQSLCFRDSGLDVIVGVRVDGPSAKLAAADGMKVASISDAAATAQIVHILVPDEVQKTVYQEHIARHMTAGKTLSFSHGFNIVYRQIVPPEGVDVILVAPKAPGSEERKEYVRGKGVPGLVSVRHDATGEAMNRAMAMARGLGLTRAGVMECSFEDETYEDLFGEQTVLCGGVAELMKAGFETLIEAGYPPEMAYFECVHETKLIVDLIYEGGLTRMWQEVSNTAEYGGRTVGPRIIGPEVKAAMKVALTEVQDGTFAKNWIKEYADGMPVLTKLREDELQHPVEVVGEQVRAMFGKD